MPESNEELVERLEQAAADVREATREAHEALADLRAVIKEARELLTHEVEKEVDSRVKREVDRQLASLSKRVKRTLGEKGIK